MMEQVKQQWKEFKEAKPGSRFEQLYERCHEDGVSPLIRFVLPALGVLLVIAGIILIPAPGPGHLTLALGLGLIGTAIKPLSRFMDRAEIKVRAAVSEVKALWRQASPGLKTSISATIITVLLGAGYGCYQLFVASSN